MGNFAITTAAADPIRADKDGRAQAVFTVTNTTRQALRGMARVRALRDTRQEWLSLDGEADRDFGGGATEQFTVNFSRPTGGSLAADKSVGPPVVDDAGGIYAFRLDIASATNPDEDFAEGPVVRVDVAPSARQAVKKPFPKWVFIPIAVVILIAAGVGLWLALRNGGEDGIPVPNVIGKSPATATDQLTQRKLNAKVATETKVTGTVLPGQVALQDPFVGTIVEEGTTVELTIEGPKPPTRVEPPTGGRPPPIKIGK